MKNIFYATAFTIFLGVMSTAYAATYSYSELEKARLACMNAPSSTKKTLCNKYYNMLPADSDAELAAAKKECDKAQPFEKDAKCYRYKQLLALRSTKKTLRAMAQ